MRRAMGTDLTETEIHPVVYEVVRNRLLSVTEEMRIALQSVSGSPTVTEASDFFTGLYVPDGSFASMGFQVTHEAPPVGALIQHLNRTGRVVRDGNVYYAYSSPTGGRYLPVLASADLKTWYVHLNWSTNGPPGKPGYSVATDSAIPSEIRASAMSDWTLARPASTRPARARRTSRA